MARGLPFAPATFSGAGIKSGQPAVEGSILKEEEGLFLRFLEVNYMVNRCECTWFSRADEQIIEALCSDSKELSMLIGGR